MQRSECRTPSWLGGYAERRSISMIEHQNAKYEHKGKFTWSMPIDEASKFLLHPLQAHCMEKITAWRSGKNFLATQKNMAIPDKQVCSNKILQIRKNNSVFILLLQNKAISLHRNSRKQPLAVSHWPLAKQRNTNQKQNIKHNAEIKSAQPSNMTHWTKRLKDAKPKANSHGLLNPRKQRDEQNGVWQNYD